MQVQNYTRFGGTLWKLAALRHVVGHHRVIGRQTSAPLSEALLYGVAGGIGASFQVGESVDEPPLRFDLGSRYKSLVGESLQALCVRLGLPASFRHTASAEIAEHNLRIALERDEPVILYGQAPRLPHLVYPGVGDGHYFAVAFGVEGKGADSVVELADTSASPVHVPLSELIDAGAGRHLCVYINAPAAPVDLPKAIESGVRACCDRMLDPPHPRTSFGLRALSRLAEGMMDVAGRPGWARALAPGAPLTSALLCLYAAIELGEAGPEGGRGIFADFLREAGAVLQGPDLGEVVDRYEALAVRWRGVGEALLPASCPPLAELRRLLQARASRLAAGGEQARVEVEALRDRILELRAEVERDFPLDAAGRAALFNEIHERLQVLYADEEQAIRELKLSIR